MHNTIKNIVGRFNKETTTNTCVGILLLVAVILFYLFRPEELIILIPVTTVVAFFTLFPATKKINRKVKILALSCVVLCYLIYSYFNSRIYSYDGGLYHIKYMLAIVDKWYIATTEYPVRPYLGEYIFAIIYKFLGLRALNLILGILTLLNVYLANILIKKLTKDELERKLSLALFVFSPTFIALSTIELKPDQLSFTVLLLLILLFMNIEKSKYKLSPLIGLFSGLSILIKTSSSFIVVWFMLLILHTLIKSKELLINKILLVTSTLISFILPLIVWFLIFGGTFPQLENVINVKPLINNNSSNITLERDRDLLKICNEDKLKKDYSSFIYGSRSFLVFLQPLFYITRFRAYSFAAQGMANPGIFLYIGIWILPIFLIVRKKFQIDQGVNSILWVSFLSTATFMVLVSSIFWYLLPIFPIYAITISKLINKIDNKWIKKSILILCYSTIVVNITVGFVTALQRFAPVKNLSEEQIQKTGLKKIYETNMKINNIPNNSLILDASEHPFNINTMFIKDADKRIVKSNYYFASKERSFESLREELLKNNIKFIIVNKDYLLDSFYEGCPLQNNLRLLEFLEKYTVPVYEEEPEYEKLIFRII